jgi:hypothetical protein
VDICLEVYPKVGGGQPSHEVQSAHALDSKKKGVMHKIEKINTLAFPFRVFIWANIGAPFGNL